MKKLTEEELIKNVTEECKKRGDVQFLGINGEFKGNKTKLKLRCEKDNYCWSSTAYCYFINRKDGCPLCSGNLKLDKENLIENVIEKCKIKDYTFLGINGEFKGATTKLKLYCKKHLISWESTSYTCFINRGYGCFLCGKEKVLSSKILSEEVVIKNVIEECKKRNYEFLEVIKYDSSRSKLKLRCITHNFIWIAEYHGFMGKQKNGCLICAGNLKLTEEKLIENVQKECSRRGDVEFIEMFSEFKGCYTKLKLHCLKDNFIWTSCTYDNFVNKAKNGCPSCKSSKLEIKIKNLLKENNINFIPQYSFDELKTQFGKQTLDFFLPDYNIAIECQGRQHFEPVDFFGGELNYRYTLECDERKYNICKAKGIRILYYAECRTGVVPTNYHDEIFTNTSDLLAEIF